MWSVVISLLLTMRISLRHRAALHLEILALRHQLKVVERSHPRRVRLTGLAATARGMGIEEIQTAPRSPWQNAYAERLIGSIRRECLDHVIVLNEVGLSRILTQYLTYYHQSRTHLSQAKDSPQSRTIALPTCGPIVATPQVGGLHHRYDRRAA